MYVPTHLQCSNVFIVVRANAIWNTMITFLNICEASEQFFENALRWKR